jgi:AcrR family transcriptional regulator
MSDDWDMMTKDHPDSTRDRLKNVARRLFCERGVEDVSIRDILTAAGQRNIGAIGYYFQSKDALVRELLLDGAKIIDQRRTTALDLLERGGSPITLHDIIALIVRSAIDLEGSSGGETWARFFCMLQRDNVDVFMESMSNHQDVGFRRCVGHLRQLLPELPREDLNERIIFMMIAIVASLSFREAALEQRETANLTKIYGGKVWISESLIDNLIASCEGMFTRPLTSTAIDQVPQAAAS